MNITVSHTRWSVRSLCVIIMLVVASCAGSRPDNPALDRKVTELLDSNDFFRLETALNTNGSQLTEARELYFRAYVQNAFNQPEQALQTIDRLLSAHRQSLNDTLVANMLGVKSDSHVNRFEYRQAAETYQTLLEQYSHVLDSTDIESIQNSSLPLFRLLADAPPQTMHITHDVTIPVVKNQFGHVTVPVSTNSVHENFVFDTGANISTIVESCAAQMGIRPLEGSVSAGTSTDIKLSVKIGVADSLRIGRLLFRNVVFLIVPDEQLSFPQVNYFIRGVIGFPLMYQMKEIRTGNSSITVPQTPVKRDLHNIFMNGLYTVVQLQLGADTLLLNMDTGASTSELSKKYFDAHRESVMAEGTLQTIKRGGAGGIIETEVYELTNVPIGIGGFEMTLPKLNVETREYLFNEDFDGNLGQDVLMQFSEMILNLESMYLTFTAQ